MKLSGSQRAAKHQRDALDAGCKKLGFIASVELQQKIDFIMEKRKVKQKKELFQMLIEEEYRKTTG